MIGWFNLWRADLGGVVPASRILQLLPFRPTEEFDMHHDTVDIGTAISSSSLGRIQAMLNNTFQTPDHRTAYIRLPITSSCGYPMDPRLLRPAGERISA